MKLFAMIIAAALVSVSACKKNAPPTSTVKSDDGVSASAAPSVLPCAPEEEEGANCETPTEVNRSDVLSLSSESEEEYNVEEADDQDAEDPSDEMQEFSTELDGLMAGDGPSNRDPSTGMALTAGCVKYTLDAFYTMDCAYPQPNGKYDPPKAFLYRRTKVFAGTAGAACVAERNAFAANFNKLVQQSQKNWILDNGTNQADCASRKSYQVKYVDPKTKKQATRTVYTQWKPRPNSFRYAKFSNGNTNNCACWPTPPPPPKKRVVVVKAPTAAAKTASNTNTPAKPRPSGSTPANPPTTKPATSEEKAEPKAETMDGSIGVTVVADDGASSPSATYGANAKITVTASTSGDGFFGEKEARAAKSGVEGAVFVIPGVTAGLSVDATVTVENDGKLVASGSGTTTLDSMGMGELKVTLKKESDTAPTSEEPAP